MKTAERYIGDVREAVCRKSDRESTLLHLERLVARFARETATMAGWDGLTPLERYPRLLLNSETDHFQIVVSGWAPHFESPIHDHADGSGVVACMSGETLETRYDIVERVGRLVRLRRVSSTHLQGEVATRLGPEPGAQLHSIANRSSSWALTVHVYLERLVSYRTYAPVGEGWFEPSETALWFDGVDAWRLWDDVKPARDSKPLRTKAPPLAATTRAPKG